jgi:glycerophosphoryl diester phosphodiesterase
VSETEAHAYFAAPHPRVFAHRGLATAAPENTLAAFQGALDAGADYLESDIRATRDGVAVLSHDRDLRRLTGTRATVRGLLAAELAALEWAGRDRRRHRVLTLTEALERFPAARFNLDIKSADAVKPAVAAIRAAGATHRVLLTSFDERRRAAAVAALPGVATSASVSIGARALQAIRLGRLHVVARVLSGVHAVQVPESMYGLRVVSPRTVDVFHRAGVEVHVWTVNAPADMSRLISWGVDGIITDRADLAVAVIRGTYLSS